MSVVGGTQGYVSGQIIPVSEGSCCDNHNNTPAVSRVVGEVDQFGYEASDFCHECVQKYEHVKFNVKVKVCELCGCQVDHLRPRKHVDKETKIETIDMACDVCIGKQVHEAVKQMEEQEDTVEDLGIDCTRDEDEDDDYRFDLKENEARPLNFNNPSHRW